MSALNTSDPTIHVRRRRREVHAPVAIWEDLRLKLSTRAILPYLLHLQDRPEWEIRVSAVCRALGIGRATWDTARRDMEANGYYKAEKYQLEAGVYRHNKLAGGKWVWKHWVTDIPNVWDDDPDSSGSRERLSRDPSPRKARDGEPADGAAGARRSRNIHALDLHDLDSRKKEEAEATPPAAAGAAANSAKAKAKSSRRGSPCELIGNVEVWHTTDDPQRFAASATKLDPDAFQEVLDNMPAGSHVGDLERAVDKRLSAMRSDAAEERRRVRDEKADAVYRKEMDARRTPEQDAFAARLLAKFKAGARQ